MIFWLPLVFILALWFLAVTVAVVVLWNRKGSVHQEEIDRLRRRIDALENASRPAKPEAPTPQPIRVAEPFPPPLPAAAVTPKPPAAPALPLPQARAAGTV